MGCTLLRPLMKIDVSYLHIDDYTPKSCSSQVQQVTEERYGFQGNYRPVISYPPSEWCGVMFDSTFNPIYRLAVETVSSVPELMHICPYWVITSSRLLMSFNTILFILMQGPVYAYNITLNLEKLFALFQPGDYANTLLIFDDIDRQIFKVKIFTTVR